MRSDISGRSAKQLENFSQRWAGKKGVGFSTARGRYHPLLISFRKHFASMNHKEHIDSMTTADGHCDVIFLTLSKRTRRSVLRECLGESFRDSSIDDGANS